VQQFMRNVLIYKSNSLTIVILAVVLCFCTACTDKQSETPVKHINRNALPRMSAENVVTLISDSGITRYRITTPLWYMYDKVPEPYWAFPKGLHLQRFNERYHIDAEINCKRAFYYQNRQLWKLEGKVKALNLQGETFESEQIFWSQRDKRIYSDSLIRITKQTQIIVGKAGFESNESMTKYIIKQTNGIIPVKPTQ